ncbi:hypothetical protein [Candidatus Nitrosocosmicus arcticus]|uniref:hypothetical protein n=1 Tax=Candidatus Nitrosocosmicus arcticus TaxID=2035267 RepID=UPI001C9592D0|nr:hypothetical protein [Candidatus Nitrosocosmicus arcticus]
MSLPELTVPFGDGDGIDNASSNTATKYQINRALRNLLYYNASYLEDISLFVI